MSRESGLNLIRYVYIRGHEAEIVKIILKKNLRWLINFLITISLFSSDGEISKMTYNAFALYKMCRVYTACCEMTNCVLFYVQSAFVLVNANGCSFISTRKRDALPAQNRPLILHLLPPREATDVGKVVTLHWHACQSLMHLWLLMAAHEGSRRRGAGNLFLLAILPPSLPLSAISSSRLGYLYTLSVPTS